MLIKHFLVLGIVDHGIWEEGREELLSSLDKPA